MKILIAGDSFAANWLSEDSSYLGWPNLLSDDFDVTNVAQAGVSQYKILKQIRSQDLSQFDVIIICFTDDFRLYIPDHPIHTSGLHKNCDLLVSDLDFHIRQFKNLLNFKLWICYFWYLLSFDSEYYQTISFLVKKEIMELLSRSTALIITDSDLEIKEKFLRSRGVMNHLTADDNYEVYLNIIRRLEDAEKIT